MTTVFGPVDATAGSPSYAARQERQLQAPLLGNVSNRVFGTRSGWRVGTLSSVLSVTSTTWTLQPCSAMIEPAAMLYQGAYPWGIDAAVSGPITAADATNPRIDILYVQINDSSSGDGSGALSAPVLYKAGVAAATPVAPTPDPRSFLVGTISVPKSGGGAPVATLNQQFFVSSGGLLPVSGTAERNALTPYNGLAVARTDTGSIDLYSGGSWTSFKSTNAINGGAATNLTGMQGTWTIPFTTGTRRPRVWSPDGITAYSTGIVQYGGSNSSIVTIPAQFAPADGSALTYIGSSQASGNGTVSGGPSVSLGINGGVLQVVYQSGTLPTGMYLPITGSWLING